MKKIILLLLFLRTISVSAQEERYGIITGSVVDRNSKEPLIGANVIIMGTNIGAATDENGIYRIEHAPVGAHSIKFSYIGYQPVIKTDIIVKSNRIITVTAELESAALESEEVVVAGGYFTETEEHSISAINFSYEEVRRAPGSAGDISRIMMSLPSVAKVNDQSNGLIVRGGSPAENAFYVDNIEIPNINHFPTFGTTSGPIGLLNVDFIEDATFYAGGFDVTYGDRLSSVLNIKFREGNREEYDAQLDLNWSGFGGVIEGPLNDGKGSWIFSLRRSYLDFLIKTIDMGTSVVPRYGDLQTKIVYDLNASNKISFIGIFGDDHNSPDKQTAIDNDMLTYGNQDVYEGTAGLTWLSIWGKNGYSLTSFSFTGAKFDEIFFETGTDQLLRKNNAFNRFVKLRNVNHYNINDNTSIEFGTDLKYLFDTYENFYGEYIDAVGNATPAMNISRKLNTTKLGVFFKYTTNLLRNLRVNFGVRGDYFQYNQKCNLSPRFHLSYDLNDRTKLNLSTGIYYQNLPEILLVQNEQTKSLDDPKAYHYTAGVEYLITEDTKITAELYLKKYENMPLDPSQKDLFLIDEFYYRDGNIYGHENLKSNGVARSRGIEITLQKKMSSDFYGIAGFSYSLSQYRDSKGNWRNRVYDNRIIFNIEGGYKLGNDWQFSMRWIYAGGTPYTPFDIEKSVNLNRGVLDEERINMERLPDYHSLNLRIDKRFFFRNSNMTLYVSVWNAYNRKNIASYFWHQYEKKQKPVQQWGLLPIFGIEYEF
ncbi:MAG: TonB-dependent receptor [Melioribacter sp.]|uniref:TonB-dependent receptor n=1 Tax=Melioribacter sp. TaxID=2052167 RepID=UPI003BE320F0